MSNTLSSLPPPIRPERHIGGRYELIEVAGRGGMAVVWRANQYGPGSFFRTVAVKQMHEHLADLPTYREMFCEEARVASLLSDPNITQVYDFVEDDGELFLVMEYVSGVDLATFIKYISHDLGQTTRWELVVAIGIGVLRGLTAAHEREVDGHPEPVVHRDLSPHNVLLNEKGRAKLIDFGLSLASDRDIDDTDPGMAKGRLAYLAPEVTRGLRPTPLTDQFTMGNVLHEALTGRRTFVGTDDQDTYRRLANAECAPLKQVRPDVPDALAEVVHRALALDPEERFSGTREMARQLGEVLKGYRSAEDLYAALARQVHAARLGLGIGERTQDPNVEDAMSEDLSGMVELHVEEEPPKGWGRWIPSFLRGKG